MVSHSTRTEPQCERAYFSNGPSVGYLQVDYWHTVPVSLADDAVEILEFGGQEGPESSLHPDGLGLTEAQEVHTADAPHGAGLRAVQGDQVELRKRVGVIFNFTLKHRAEMFKSGLSYPWT